MDEGSICLPIDPGHHNVVERCIGAAGLETHNQRTSLFEMLLKFRPISVEGENLEAGGFQIISHVGGEDATGLARIELLLNRCRIGALRVDAHAMSVPILHEHGNRRGPAAVFGLLYEGHVEPDSRAFLGHAWNRAPQEEHQEQTANGPV